MSGSSFAVRLSFPASQCPGTAAAASKMMAAFGDVARLDVSMAALHGVMTVVFFDVRCADACFNRFASMAQRVPAAEHEFRAVHVAKEVIMRLPPGFTGFRTFGEVDQLLFEDEDVVVEFFDMRPAQQLLKTFAGCKPRAQVIATPKLKPAPGLSMLGGFKKVALTEENMDVLTPMPSPLMKLGKLGSDSTLAGFGQMEATKIANKELVSAVAEWLAASDLSRGVKEVNSCGRLQPDDAGPEAAEQGLVQIQACGKVGVLLAHLEIHPEQILRGDDPRTTAMIRHIPQEMSLQAVLDWLVSVGLDQRCTALVMPTEKQSNRHCGFAFVDFLKPEDVFKLYDKVHGAGAGCDPAAIHLAVSYARLQGHHEMQKCFPEYFRGRNGRTFGMVPREAGQK
mmetsp:Transcript_43682/g.100811  ORF Transcript_43682/g.100811 Transcript_43682/m.100811 type:complete len:396 (-) Transcript_43682:220-1407(-)